jgi:hypothetical protein
VWGYTWQLGNGLSATVAAEDRRNTQIIGSNFGALPAGGFGSIVGASTGCGINTCSTASSIGTVNVNNFGYGGYQAPDVVANIRLDQAWGSAQVMGAWHLLNPEYYNSTLGGIPGGQWTGHPGNQSGWAVGAGLRLNFPMFAQGDYFQSQVNYTQGAMRYLNGGAQSPNWIRETQNNATFGIISDCVYGSNVATTAVGVNPNTFNATGCNLTTGWNVNAAFEHYWTPQLHQSIVGQYGQVRYNDQANNILCGLESAGGGVGNLNGGTQAHLVNGVPVAFGGCGNNWNLWGASSRLQWDVTKSFYLGVEVVYEHMDSASSATGTLPAGISMGATSPSNAFVHVGSNAENVWVGTVRMHKDFLP